jgi:hypothetical protein
MEQLVSSFACTTLLLMIDFNCCKHRVMGVQLQKLSGMTSLLGHNEDSVAVFERSGGGKTDSRVYKSRTGVHHQRVMELHAGHKDKL